MSPTCSGTPTSEGLGDFSVFLVRADAADDWWFVSETISPQFRSPQALNSEQKQTREEKDPAGAFCMTSNLYIDFI